MALRQFAFPTVCRISPRFLSSVLDRVVSINLVDSEGIRHTVKGLVGEFLHDVLAAVPFIFRSFFLYFYQNDELRESVMGIPPNASGAWDTHVFVSKEIMKQLPPLSPQELDDLDKLADNTSSQSRMASRIQLSKDFDGATVALGDIRPWKVL